MDFPDGVFLVTLAGLNDPELVAITIARELQVAERPELEPLAAIREHLVGKQLLLVLYNFEHVVAAGPTISQLLATSPGLEVLVAWRSMRRQSVRRLLRTSHVGRIIGHLSQTHPARRPPGIHR